MVKQFQNGGQATGAQEQLIQAFMLDLGSVLGAKNEQEALQIGQATIQKLGKMLESYFKLGDRQNLNSRELVDR